MDERERTNQNGVRGVRFHCTECEQTFGRVEHLTRHSRSHMKERLLQCTYCRKGFYRIDALRRHEQIHKEPRRSVLGKGARACIACAAARRKCTGGIPCSGCGKRSLDCSYPGARRSGRSVPRPEVEHENGSLNSRGQDTSNHQNSPISCSTADSPREQDQGQIQASFTGNNEEGQYSVSSMSHDQAGSFQGQASLPSALTEPSTIGFEQSTIQLQPASPLLELQDDSSLAGPWYEGNGSSLNWLPYNWSPDFQVGIGNTFGSLEGIQSPNLGRHHRVGSSGFDGTDHSTFTRYQTSPELHGQANQALPGSEASGDHGISSPGSHSTQSAGHYYIDGDGSRLPRVRKAPYRITEPATAPRDETRHLSSQFSFPDLDESLHAIPTAYDTILLSPAIYDEILAIFGLSCVSSMHYSQFSSPKFPSLAIFTSFIYLFNQNFRSVLPFIHSATFDPTRSHWLLILALAAAGSHYVDIEDSRLYSIPMHEFLRRAIQVVAEGGEEQKPDLSILAQAKLLNCVGMIYSGDEYSMTTAKSYHGDLASFCDAQWNESISRTDEELRDASYPLSQKWKVWYEAESRRRTGYCIWLLDCMFAFHFQMRPLLSLEDAKAPIPCQEVLWEADSALDWQQLYSCSTPSPSLHSAIQLAYLEKRIQSSTGEFSRILCIHALFHRTWEVESYLTQPLTLWDPTAERQDIRMIQKAMPVWLPDLPTYSKWRNSACDCLDILHWHANSVIGAASGMEHPTVLHLHLARVILLTPFRKIVQLAELMSHERPDRDDDETASITKDVQRWATEDQYKARLAMIHAGVLFWHVRRYSVDAFYEPSSVFLATLALWAYGRFAAQTTGHTSNAINKHGETSRDSDEDDADSLFPTSMQLDRPADDELVQLFVKRGVTMKANIMGVGNLCSRNGHVRVLVEGRNLLLGLKKWGDARRLVKKLDALIEVCQVENRGLGT